MPAELGLALTAGRIIFRHLLDVVSDGGFLELEAVGFCLDDETEDLFLRDETENLFLRESGNSSQDRRASYANSLLSFGNQF